MSKDIHMHKHADQAAAGVKGAVERETGVDAEDHTRSAYLWNTAGSLLNAFQSVIMLMVITRVSDLETAGVFTLAYASANLFLNMGNYGMRNFQASDVKPEYPFASYWRSRLVTDIAMLVCSSAYLLWSATRLAYPSAKSAAIVVMMLLKLVDSVEDITDGNCQQHGRLDVGGKLLTLRTGSFICVFIASMVLLRNLVASLTITVAWSLTFYIVGIMIIRRRVGLPTGKGDPDVPAWHGVWQLLRECAPLFLAAFLLFYIGNAAKYAIDAQLDDTSQAIYGFIAMPVFVVGLLAQFIYMPIVEPLSRTWDAGDATGFRREFGRQALYIAGITLVCDLGGFILGEPVLGWLYATDLTGYGLDLVVLVTGGGFLALAQLFTMGITVIRRQRLLTPGYVAVALVALLTASPVVARWGIDGASWAYIAYMAVLALLFAGIFLRCSAHPVKPTTT